MRFVPVRVSPRYWFLIGLRPLALCRVSDMQKMEGQMNLQALSELFLKKQIYEETIGDFSLFLS